jgi:phenylpyruvate tautomerase PptA (4-oxalocrotonate tautomerase family)
MADDPTVIWQSPEGQFKWLQEMNDDVADAITEIALAMRGETDEAISVAINSYLAGLCNARKLSLH